MRDHDLTDDQDFIFIEITVADPSEFATRLDVHGQVMHRQYRVLTLRKLPPSPTPWPPSCCISADETGYRPHIYLEWTEGHPAVNFLRFLFFGVGEVAPVTREVLRRAEPDRSRRPHVHAG